jgi:hypothetical protein
MSYFTYAHYKPNGEIFYIGKGSIKRAHSVVGRNVFWKRIVEKYKTFKVQILCEWKTEKEAFQHEILLIDCFKEMGAKLANIAKGGFGSSGFRHSEEFKQKQKENFKNNNPMSNLELKIKHANALKIAMSRPEVREKIRVSRVGKKFSDSHIESLRVCHPMRPCVINGIEYKSLMEASRSLNIRHGTLFRWLNNPNVKHNKKFNHIIECRWK